MNLNHLSIFHAVANEGSVSAGAERLLISQPAVSKQLKMFEKSLGVTLFDRHPRGVRLTAAGEILAGFAERIFSLEDQAQCALQECEGVRRGRLAIGASTTIGVYMLPEVFVRFRQRHPQIDLTLEVGSSGSVQQKLLEDAINVAFTEVAPEEPALEATPFASDELVAIAPPNHSLLKKRRVTPERFCQEPIVVRATGSDTKSFVERALVQRGLAIKPVLSLGSTEAIKRAVAAGIGVAIVSSLAIGLELKARTLAVVKLSGPPIRRPLYRVAHRGRTVSAALNAFLAMMAAHAAVK
jgi:DNA-binding transcriptional LysR family regulator